MTYVLHQFPYSHFNEKARWALDLKKLDHERVNYLPGPHMPKIKKLSGQSKTPVLTGGGRTVAGSAQIIDWLEEVAPAPALYPEAPDLRAEALAWQDRLDREFGLHVRRALFSEMVDEGAYFCRMFADGKPKLVQWAYRATYPLAKPLVKKGNGITGSDATAAAFAMTDQYFDEIAKAVERTGFLVGDQFSVADLTAAALAAPAVNPDHPDMSKPDPKPVCVQNFIARFADHPTTAWVRDIYTNCR
jgi:glutathione S-transferase